MYNPGPLMNHYGPQKEANNLYAPTANGNV